MSKIHVSIPPMHEFLAEDVTLDESFLATFRDWIGLVKAMTGDMQQTAVDEVTQTLDRSTEALGTAVRENPLPTEG